MTFKDFSYNKVQLLLLHMTYVFAAKTSSMGEIVIIGEVAAFLLNGGSPALFIFIFQITSLADPELGICL